MGGQEEVVAPGAFFRMVSIVWTTAAQAGPQRRRDCHAVHELVGETGLWDGTAGEGVGSQQAVKYTSYCCLLV